MTTATIKTIERKCDAGEWECMSDVWHGYVEIRNTNTGKRFTVKVAAK